MDRWTIKELRSTSNINFAISILNERRYKITPYSPLGMKLAEAAHTLCKIEEMQKNRYEKIYLKATEKRNASWVDTAIAALAADLEAFTGKPVKISGPFGLRAEIYVKAGDTVTVITPDFSDGFKLYYDTGEIAQRYQPLTMGDVNGLNNVQAPLPETFEEIVAIFTGARRSRNEKN